MSFDRDRWKSFEDSLDEKLEGDFDKQFESTWRYAKAALVVAGVAVIAILILVGWVAIRLVNHFT
jgi:hypothetical protein